MEVLRSAILQPNPNPPEDFALRTVQEVIKPQRPTKLAQDENQLLENMLRMLLQELVSSAAQSGGPIMQYGQSIDDGENSQGQIPRLLDIVLYLCEKEHVEGGMIFQLLEDLTEMSTIRNCKDIFGYIESKQDTLGKQELFARGKLVMLRTCNQLLRRLSKANDVVFCGRILMFLAHFFPLSERSAVNIKGVFNTSNETKYEKDPPIGLSIDFNFYKTLWSLQENFCNPASLSPASNKWQKFSSNLAVVLSTFEAQPLSEEEGDANNLEEEASSFNTKYLTSSKLMGLELKDPSFRRHILVQCLILFDYLKAPGKNDKDVTPESMKEEIKSCEERVKKLLEMTPPKGMEFLDKVEHILDREKNWVWWKRDSCPPFEKQLAERKTTQDGNKKRKIRWRLGNKELSQLWKWADQNPNALTDPQRVRTPAITEYWKPLAEDMDPSAGIEAEYHHKNNRVAHNLDTHFSEQAVKSCKNKEPKDLNYCEFLNVESRTVKVYCWKGLRFSARQDLDGFSRFSEFGVEGVVPLELLTPDVRSKYQAKPSDKSKRAKKDEGKDTSQQAEENQVATPANEGDGEGMRANTEVGGPMDTDTVAITSNMARVETSSPEEDQKNSPEAEVGHEAGPAEVPDADAEPGLADGETDAEVDLEAVG